MSDMRSEIPPTPNEMQQLFSTAQRYGYWLASPDENAAIGISLPQQLDLLSL
jgi:hypothetical protein